MIITITPSDEIQKCISSSHVGDYIKFDGMFELSRTVNLEPHRFYDGMKSVFFFPPDLKPFFTIKAERIGFWGKIRSFFGERPPVTSICNMRVRPAGGEKLQGMSIKVTSEKEKNG